ncbi:MAG: hypothetical protein JKX92_10445 [Porticoccaceae bacterium]|nr:hypothetical protein [Porticoccaceae bacterium]
MPGEAIADFILRPLLEILLQLIGYFTSRVIFPVISFGYIFVAPATKGVKVFPKWHGINRASNGKIVLHEEMGALLGIIFWFLVIGISIYVYSLSSSQY